MSATPDMFDAPRQLESLGIPDADLRFMHGFYAPPLSTELMDILMREIPWRQEKIKVWGKVHNQPRLTSWHGNAGTDYTYSGITLDTLPWTPVLSRIRRDIEAATGHAFNSVLLNLYRDGKDGVGWHSDNEDALGRMPVIASLSLGESRTFRLRPRDRRKHKPFAIDLTDGSLLLMAGATQQCWQHAIDKEHKEKGPRINLTFRNIMQKQPC